MKAYRLSCETCGHTGTYKSAALAARQFNSHSCATTLERAARRRRRLARLRSSGEKRDCTCPRARHEHGTRSAYVLDKCRCRPCRDASSAYERGRQRTQLYGRPRSLVGAGPARDLRQLMADGMGLKQIARTGEIAYSSLSGIIYGKPSTDPREHRQPRQRISRTLEARILAVPLELAAGATIDATGTARRIQALAAVGWSLSDTAAALGITRANFTAIAWGRRKITVATARAVRDLYEQRWNQPPPQHTRRDRNAYSRARHLAEANKWLKPLELDDDRIDDPTWVPDPPARLPGRGRRTDRLLHHEDVEWLHDCGLDLAAIAARLGVQPSSLQTLLERRGRRDLWLAISKADKRRRAAPRQVA